MHEADPRSTPPSTSEGRGEGKKVPWGFIVPGLLIAGVGAYAFYYATSRSRVDEEALLHGTLIGIFGLLLLATGLGRVAGRAAGVVFVISALVLPSVAYYFAAEREADNRAAIESESLMYERLLPACEEGSGIRAAYPYDRGPGVHPIAIFTRPDDGEWRAHRNQNPEGWEPSSAEEAELVACIRSHESVVEYCSYSGSSGTGRSLRRLRYSAEYQLFDALGHRELTSGRIIGSEPPPCPAEVRSGSPGFVSGSYPANTAVFEELRPWVEGG